MPKITRADLERALMYFDQTSRDSEKFIGWEQKPEYSLVVENKGRRYPVIPLYSYMTGYADVKEHDERDAWTQFDNLGFKVYRQAVEKVNESFDLGEGLKEFSRQFAKIRKIKQFAPDEELIKIAGSIRKTLEEAGIFSIYSVEMTLHTGDEGKWENGAAIVFSQKKSDAGHGPMRCTWYLYPEAAELVLVVELSFEEIVEHAGREEALDLLGQSALRIRLLCQEMAAERNFDLGELPDDLLPAKNGELHRMATVANKRYRLSGELEEMELVKDLILMLDLARDYGELAMEARAAAVAKEKEAPRKESKEPFVESGRVITNLDEAFDGLKEPDTFERLAEKLYMPSVWTERMHSVLDLYGQLLLTGPQGSAKSHTSRGLGLALAEDLGRLTFLPLTPGSSIALLESRKVKEDGTWEIVDGPLKELAHKAASDPDNVYVLVIDDIHFLSPEGLGEAYYLLKNRTEFMPLKYSGDNLAIPVNLKVIATATCDDPECSNVSREIFMVFPIVRFSPTMPPVRGMLARWLDVNAPDIAWLAKMVDEVNSSLSPSRQVGPAFFMREHLDEPSARITWDHIVLPLLAMALGDDSNTLKGFEFETLRHKVTGAIK